MPNILPPPALQGDEQAQLTQVYRYLFRLSEELNMALDETQRKVDYIQQGTGGQGGIVDEKKLSDGLYKQYSALKSLIIKTADVVRLEMNQIVTNLDLKYVAESEFGTYKEEVSREIIDTAKETIENFEYGEEVFNIPKMMVDFEAYRIEAKGYIRRGIIGYDDMGYPIFGIAIGQELKGRVVTIDGVEYDEFDTTHNMATYTADKLSFWINGVEVAYLSQSQLVITRAVISDSIQLGDWNIAVNANDGLTIQQRIGNEIVTASQINMVANDINLSANKSLALNASLIRAVVEGLELTAEQIDAITGKIVLTTDQIDAIANRIELTADQIDAVIGNIKLSAEQIEAIAGGVKLTADQIDTIVENIELTAEQIKMITDGIVLDADQIDTISKKITITADKVNAVADQIDLSGNKSIKLTAQQVNAVADEIDLSGNKSITLTAEQINAVANQIDLSANDYIRLIAHSAETSNANFRQNEIPAGDTYVRPGDTWTIPETGQVYQAEDASDLNLKFYLDTDGGLYYEAGSDGENISFEVRGFDLYGEGLYFSVLEDGTPGTPYVWRRVQDRELADAIRGAAIHDGAAPPEAPIVAGKLWLDRSVSPMVLRRWLGLDADPADMSGWETVNDTATISQALEQLRASALSREDFNHYVDARPDGLYVGLLNQNSGYTRITYTSFDVINAQGRVTASLGDARQDLGSLTIYTTAAGHTAFVPREG